MCEYCEGKKDFTAEYAGEGIQTMKMNLALLGWEGGYTIYMANIKNGILFADTSGGEYAELGFKINYCPNCGAKIQEVEE